MNFSVTYVLLLIAMVLLYISYRKDKALKMHIKDKSRKRKGLENEMTDFINRNMNNEIIVKTISGDYVGILSKFEENYITLTNKNETKIAINLEYVVTLSEIKKKNK